MKRSVLVISLLLVVLATAVIVHPAAPSPSAAAGSVAEAWVARYNGPGNLGDGGGAIAVDGAGNVYVTGSSAGAGTSIDYATIKYNSSGAQQWVARYNGKSNRDDYAYAVALDSAGNVYVTGESRGRGPDYDYATVKYNSAGAQQWVARYDSGADDRVPFLQPLAVDAWGNVYVTGTSGTDYATVKYSSRGRQQWVARYSSSTIFQDDLDDYAYAISVDGAGNAYVAGAAFCQGGLNYCDGVTIKYNASGAEEWVARYNGGSSSQDYFGVVATDAAGNVYVTGVSDGWKSQYDYVTVEYSPAGVQRWVARYNGPTSQNDWPQDLTLDAAGNVYVTGLSMLYSEPPPWPDEPNSDYATVKYDSAGAEQWVARYSGPGDGREEAWGIAVDSSGNAYVTGQAQGTGTGTDYATVKYDASGAEQWVVSYNGPGNGGEWTGAIAVDGAGNVYVTGGSQGAGTAYYDYATVKYVQGVTPTEIDYFALGDSVASGHGLMDQPECRRSGHAYPFRVARWLRGQYDQVYFPTANHLACSGARVKDLPGQVSQVLSRLSSRPHPRPALVSITIGINDFDWGDPINVLTGMTQSEKNFRSWVDGTIDGKNGVKAKLKAQVERLLQHPDVTVVVTEYHNPFNTQSWLFEFAQRATSGVICGIWSDCYERTEYAVHKLNQALYDIRQELGSPKSLQVARLHLAFHGRESPTPQCGLQPPGVDWTWVQYLGQSDSNSIPETELKWHGIGVTIPAGGDCFHPNYEGADFFGDAVIVAAMSALP
jgi:lysophospholipase L1-like esterase